MELLDRITVKHLFLVGTVIASFGSYTILRRFLCNQERESLDTLEWEAGDILSCIQDGLWGPFDGEHFMLAVSNNSVIHLVKPLVFTAQVYYSRKGYIKEQTRDRIRSHLLKCHNYGKTYDKPVSEAIEEARKYTNREVYMHIVFCNCQHWVNKVTKGYPGFSSSSLMWAAPWCTFNGKVKEKPKPIDSDNEDNDEYDDNEDTDDNEDNDDNEE